jgi:7-cyano-7-deazaguanine synthase
MGNKQAILLLSGGIDSTTLLAKLKSQNYDIIAVSFHYGQKHEIEINYAKKNAEIYGVKNHHIFEFDKILFKSSALINSEIDITTFENNDLPEGQVNAYVPFRNLLFISAALSLAETLQVKEVYLAINFDDNANFWDCRTEFIEKINDIAASNSFIQIKTPFINLSKTEVIKLARQLKVDLNNTITCYQPNEATECGECLSCVTKQKALTHL